MKLEGWGRIFQAVIKVKCLEKAIEPCRPPEAGASYKPLITPS
jgi:hypothetical protein